MPSFTAMDTTAAIRASTPGAARASASADMIFMIPSYPIISPVISSTTASTMAATHSMRSWPKGCSLSESFSAARTPNITMMVLNTSDMECTASDTMAPERASSPASSFTADRAVFHKMVSLETRMATFAAFSIGSSPSRKT